MQIGTNLPAMMPLWAPKWDAATVRRGVLEVARAADRHGYAFVNTAEHLLIPPDNTVYKGPWYDPLVPLAFVAGVTSRVRLLTSVLVAPYHSPIVLGKAAATLDLLSGGRLILGIGSGHLEAEFRALNLPYEERGAMTDEWLAILRALWEPEPVRLHGRWCNCEEMNVDAKPE